MGDGRRGDPYGSGQRSRWTVEEMVALYPQIPWREPLVVHVPPGITGYACRICVGQRGLVGLNVALLPGSPAEHEQHFALCHPNV